MDFLLLLFKAYVVALLLRWIMTKQELNFNFLGRGIAKITDPLLAHKGKLKSETDRFIPLIIILITLLYSVIWYFFMESDWVDAVTYSFAKMALFLALFFTVCVLLGSMATSASGAFPLYFYRLGNIWVTPVRKIFPLRGNAIIIPTLLFIMLSFLLIYLPMTYICFAVSTDILRIVTAGVLVFAFGITSLLFGLVILIIVRALMSWVSPDPRNIIVQMIYYITEPVLTPIRRIVPPIGMLDLSALVTIVLLSLLRGGIIRFLASTADSAGLSPYILWLQ